MISRYRAAYTPTGAAAFSVAAFISRFAIAIYPIALVLIVSDRTGNYGFGGVVSGLFVVGEAIGNPIAGVLVDRFSQHRMLPRYLAGHITATAVMALLLVTSAPLWSFVLPAMAMGATMLNIGALVRARWSYVWPNNAEQRSVAYSAESTLDELIFVLGPLVATVLATHADPLFTLLVAVCLITGGSTWLARQRRTEPPVVHHVGPRPSALRNRGMGNVIAVMVCMGAVFGSAEVNMVAFAGQHGQRGQAGLILASFAGGSALAGLVYGSRRWRMPVLRRFVISASIFGVLPFLYLAAHSVLSLCLLTAVIGLGIAPTLIAGFGLVDNMVPAASLTEGLTWIGTGLSVGFGLGASVVGGVADAHGAHSAFWVPIGFALIGAGCALGMGRRLATSNRAGVNAALPATVG